MVAPNGEMSEDMETETRMNRLACGLKIVYGGPEETVRRSDSGRWVGSIWSD